MKRSVKRKNIPAIRREEILKAATELFAEKGYHGVSVDSIAKTAGISKGNLYWHFKSKKEIFRQLFEHLAQTMYLPLISIIEEDTPPKDKLRALSRACINAAESNPEAILFGWQIAAQPKLKEIFASEYTEWMEPFISLLVPIFTEIGEKKPEDIARFYALTIDALMAVTVMMPQAMDKDKILSVIDERFINYVEDINE